MNRQPTPSEVTVEEAGELTGRPLSTIRRWCQNGTLRARKVAGKVWLIDIASIEALAPAKSRWVAAVGLMKAALPYLDTVAARSDSMRPKTIADGFRALIDSGTIPADLRGSAPETLRQESKATESSSLGVPGTQQEHRI